MIRYIFKRVILLIPVILVTSFISYSMVYLSPGDPAELILQKQLSGNPNKQQVASFKKEHGLDKPIMTQYLIWLRKAISGDLGKSLQTGLGVWDEYKHKFVATAELFLVGELIALGIAIPLGIWSAIRSNSIIDHVLRIVALGGISLPNFWLGLLLVYTFSIKMHIFPALGYGRSINLVIPALTIGITGAMGLMRITRTSILEVLRLNYVRTAKAKGLTEIPVVTRHVLRNASIPIVTAIGMRFGHMAGGAVIIETMFAWPGIGRMLVEAAGYRDIPVIQGFVLINAILFVLINLTVDLIYMILDPRISYKARGGES